MILEAISLGPVAAAILDAAGSAMPQGRVVSRSERSAYVEYGDDLVCVVDQELYDGAINIRVRRLPEHGQRVRIDRRAARAWKPRPLPSPARIRSHVDSLRQRVADAPAFADPIALFGKGEGLTPDGDDIVAGMMLALNAVGARFDADGWLASARSRTHAISLAHLRAAAAGHASAPVHDALRALVDASCADPDGAFAGLAQVGHSSGLSALAGMKAALAAWARNPDALMPDAFMPDSTRGTDGRC
ncbi:MAG: DUF2877 domain-containing protein [Geminicoccaceae bacterium]